MTGVTTGTRTTTDTRTARGRAGMLTTRSNATAVAALAVGFFFAVRTTRSHSRHGMVAAHSNPVLEVRLVVAAVKDNEGLRGRTASILPFVLRMHGAITRTTSRICIRAGRRSQRTGTGAPGKGWWRWWWRCHTVGRYVTFGSGMEWREQAIQLVTRLS